jgi:hypothetical protein
LFFSCALSEKGAAVVRLAVVQAVLNPAPADGAAHDLAQWPSNALGIYTGERLPLIAAQGGQLKPYLHIGSVNHSCVDSFSYALGY